MAPNALPFVSQNCGHLPRLEQPDIFDAALKEMPTAIGRAGRVDSGVPTGNIRPS
jgi:hypothetical protein